MHLTDVRFLQKTQELLVKFQDGRQGVIQVADLNPQAKVISGIAPISSAQIKLYFDEAASGVIFSADQLRGLMS